MSSRALLLDFDGTVIDSVEMIYRCLDETAQEELGTPFPRDLWEEHIGLPLIETFALLGPVAEQRAEVLIAGYRRRQEQCIDQVQPFPGIPEALGEIDRSGVRLAIVTTKLRRIAVRQLERVGLRERFQVVIGFDDCRAAKPDPEPFQLAMRALQVEPGRCAGAGDTAHDIHGARAAGCLAAAALWSGVAVDGLLGARPDRSLRHPQELVELAASL